MTLALSLEGKGKKLEERGLKTELDWKNSRIHLGTKNVEEMAGREESRVKDLFLERGLYCEVENPEEIEKHK